MTTIRRCCIACAHVYHGPLACPECGEPGEPLPEQRGGPRAGAGRPFVGDAPRDQRIAVFLSVAEVEALDARRGARSRSEWLAAPLREREE